MTKWELAQMMGAELHFDRETKYHYNTTVAFGNATKHWHSDDSVDYEYAAELVFEMIRNSVNHSSNIWSH